ncbi:MULTISPECIES: hypothetical protein [Actinosynnema]|uniref:hypothetical protein n=1 Tax=Actinosynnema TaxID=40566 RepID=UPI0020A3C89E|nr:hypothetical protein [Actinosynnema pretiosum]MCP2092421.1 hypothetical protein [Actinosynnema pretiosum]
MSEPLSSEQQDEVLAAITERLVFELPAGWNYIQVVYAAVGEDVSFSGLLRMVNGAMYGWQPPDDVRESFAALRQGMAHPERGTWFDAIYRLEYPDRYSIFYNRTTAPPNFVEFPSPEAHRRELELFPRSEEHIPDWLREGAARES